MPRTAPSLAERELAAGVSELLGYQVTPRQLEGWRRRGLLRPIPRRHLGRGRGSESHITPELVEQATGVACAVRETRSLAEAALVLFARGFEVSEEVVRDGYVSLFSAVMREVSREKPNADAGEDEFDAMDRLARKLARRSAGSGANRARARLRASNTQTSLADVMFAMLVVATTGEPPDDGSIERMAIATGLDAMTHESLTDAGPAVPAIDTAAVREALRMSTIDALKERAQTVSWGDLCIARDFIIGVAKLARAMLLPAEYQGAPEALGLREFALASDLMQAVGALEAVPWLTMFPDGVETIRSLFGVVTDRYLAATSWLEAMPRELLDQRPGLGPDLLDKLDPGLRHQVQESSRAWASEHPDFARTLEQSG